MKRKSLASLALTIVITLIMASMLYIPAYAVTSTATTYTATTKTAFLTALASASAGDVINIENIVETTDFMIMRTGETVVIPKDVTININRDGYFSLFDDSRLFNYGTININFNKLELQGNSAMENHGTIINNGTLGIMDLCLFKNDHLINNFGTLGTKGKFINNGTIINFIESYFFNQGTFENAGRIEVHENFVNDGPFINTGSILTTNLTFNNRPGYIENRGTFDNRSSFNNSNGYIVNYNLFINNVYIYNGNDFGFMNYGIIEGYVSRPGWDGFPPISNPIKVTVSAYVKQTTGNTNQLFITIIEHYPNNIANIETYQITALNNDATVYKAGKYNVYVNVKGNTDVRECRLV